MAGAPYWKVYTKEGIYEAACKSPEIAAAVVSVLGDGATIRFDHSKRCIVWTEGKDHDGEAYDSYDGCAEKCLERRDAYIIEMRAKHAAKAVEYARLGKNFVSIASKS